MFSMCISECYLFNLLSWVSDVGLFACYKMLQLFCISKSQFTLLFGDKFLLHCPCDPLCSLSRLWTCFSSDVATQVAGLLGSEYIHS